MRSSEPGCMASSRQALGPHTVLSSVHSRPTKVPHLCRLGQPIGLWCKQSRVTVWSAVLHMFFSSLHPCCICFTAQHDAESDSLSEWLLPSRGGGLSISFADLANWTEADLSCRWTSCCVQLVDPGKLPTRLSLGGSVNCTSSDCS